MLFQYNHLRLPFGISSAPSIFQRTLETLLVGILKVYIYLDDILITGSNEIDLLEILDNVLTTLETAGVTVKM